ncbi:MAG: PD-(D/E)XK nuclease family protein [Nitrososphaera sp.]|nr:PD-(D/E)XK nuclease family protein [Nitrososphaera sp.]
MPVTGEENLFQALFKWGDKNAKEEDFYTKSFVLILKKLQIHEQIAQEPLATDFLNELFELNLKSLDWGLDNHITDKDSRMIPDISLDSSDLFSFIEVKVSSPLKAEQLETYREIIESKAKHQNKKSSLFALTRLGNEDKQGLADKEVSWINVWQALGRVEEKLKPREKGQMAAEPYYLIRDFRMFLKENSMGVEQVSSLPSNQNVRDLIRLLYMLKTACGSLGLRLDQKQGRQQIEDEDPWLGWWFKDEQNREGYTCGLYAEDAASIQLGFHDDVYKRVRRRCKDITELRRQLDLKGISENSAEKALDILYSLPNDFTSLLPEEQLAFIHKMTKRILEATGEYRER